MPAISNRPAQPEPEYRPHYAKCAAVSEHHTESGPDNSAIDARIHGLGICADIGEETASARRFFIEFDVALIPVKADSTCSNHDLRRSVHGANSFYDSLSSEHATISDAPLFRSGPEAGNIFPSQMNHSFATGKIRCFIQ